MSDRDGLRQLPTLQPLRDRQRPPRLARLGRLERPVVHAIGPEFAGGRRATIRVVGPGDPPPGFGHTKDEWYPYWALSRIFGDPPNPRQPPFFGGRTTRTWDYQVPVAGAYTRAPGSAVPDFVVYQARERIAIRIVTPYFHGAKGPRVQGYDLIQIVTIERQGYTVIDVASEDFIRDPTGQAVVIVMTQAIG